MTRPRRRNFEPDEKVRIVSERLIEGRPLLVVCEQFGVRPRRPDQWQARVRSADAPSMGVMVCVLVTAIPFGGAALGCQSEPYTVAGPTEDPAYPTISPDLDLGMYVGKDYDAIVSDYVQRLLSAGDATGPIEVLEVAGVWQDDAYRLGLSPEQIAWGSEPDVAALLSGTFHPLFPAGRGGERSTNPYLLVVIDRTSGTEAVVYTAGNLERLSAMMPD